MAIIDGLPRVLFNNEFTNADTVVASTELEGFEGANAYDWKSNTSWITTASGSTLTATFSSPVSADSFGIYKHTLGDAGATLFLEHDTGGSIFVTDLTIAPSDNVAIMKTFTSESSTVWRIRITYPGSAPSIAVVAFGDFLEFERGIGTGFASPALAGTPEILNSESQTGNFIGRTLLSNKAQSTMSINNMSDAYARASWETFIQSIQLTPFFMLWLERDFPDEAAYCWTATTPPPRAYSRNQFISNSIKINMRIN